MKTWHSKENCRLLDWSTKTCNIIFKWQEKNQYKHFYFKLINVIEVKLGTTAFLLNWIHWFMQWKQEWVEEAGCCRSRLLSEQQQEQFVPSSPGPRCSALQRTCQGFHHSLSGCSTATALGDIPKLEWLSSSQGTTQPLQLCSFTETTGGSYTSFKILCRRKGWYVKKMLHRGFQIQYF